MDLVFMSLDQERHTQRARACVDSARCTSGDDSRSQSGPVQKIDSEPVAGVKTFLLFPVFEEPDAAVSQHTVAIHQEQLDACGALFDFRVHRTSKSSMPDSFQPEGVRASISTAVPLPTVPSLLARICTSAAIRFALSCSVRMTFVSHASVPILPLINRTSSPGTIRDSSSAFLLLTTACESC